MYHLIWNNNGGTYPCNAALLCVEAAELWNKTFFYVMARGTASMAAAPAVRYLLAVTGVVVSALKMYRPERWVEQHTHTATHSQTAGERYPSAAVSTAITYSLSPSMQPHNGTLTSQVTTTLKVYAAAPQIITERYHCHDASYPFEVPLYATTIIIQTWGLLAYGHYSTYRIASASCMSMVPCSCWAEPGNGMRYAPDGCQPRGPVRGTSIGRAYVDGSDFHLDFLGMLYVDKF
ncbi:hypothetical protein M422DRAFT_55746 [Sphaerobolus stellatus SS14]|uniref:Uncharacterized protein n=1 Tax=Sphaerobolus stellatus (strain SS14) TaxID=990650 RepID=A0A0C9UL58_SPHS4|nr:hypothetical protein M422DRAFT_55746 [Sphaerobolus stellatus SS14]